jgi:uncharacterized membrane protein
VSAATAGAHTLAELRQAVHDAEAEHRPLAQALADKKRDAADLEPALRRAREAGVHSRPALELAQTRENALQRVRDLETQVSASWARVEAAERALAAAEQVATAPGLEQEAAEAERGLVAELAAASRFCRAVVAQGGPLFHRLVAAQQAADAAQQQAAAARGARVFVRASERARPDVYPHLAHVLEALAAAHHAAG